MATSTSRSAEPDTPPGEVAPREVIERSPRQRYGDFRAPASRGARSPSAGPPAPTHPSVLRRAFGEPAFTRIIVGFDFVLAVAAVVGALAWARSNNLPAQGAAVIWAFPLLVLLALSARGLYRRRLRIDFLDDLGRLVGAISLAAMGLLLILLYADVHLKPSSLIVRLWILAIGLLALGRLLGAVAQTRFRRRSLTGSPVLIVGAGLIGEQVARRLADHPEYGLNPVGFLDADPLHAIRTNRVPVLGTPDDLADVARTTGAQHVVIAFSSESDRSLLRVARTCQSLGLAVSVVPRLFDAVNQHGGVEHLGGLPLFVMRHADPRGRPFAAKHAFDRIGAAIGILVFAPLLLAIAASVRLDSKGPILFRQRRIGRDGQPFELLKFRTMVTQVDEEAGHFAPHAGAAPGGVEGSDRRTRLGTLLRRSSLDELPQLLNVLRGEMSLIGPRPERPEYVDLFRLEIERYGERHRVKAGITGWAQVNGLRGQTSIADRAEWDNYYIENWSMKLDLKILVLTVLAMLHRAE